jgi:outer membrane protein assembly factor BamB
MVAFGQVESVWPAVGSVLVAGGVAYATAGRTSESDGGVAVAALEPATGKALWAKSVGAGIHRLNDVLSMRDGKLKWMFYLLDPASGEPVAGQEVHDLKYYGGGGKPFERPMLDGTWTLMPGRRSGAFEVDKAKGDLLAWSAEVAVGPRSAVARQTGEERWKAPSAAGCQVEAIALAGGTAVFAGRVRGNKPDTDTGFLWLVSLLDGKKVFETALESPPSYDGLAVAGGRLYVSLRSGAVVCFGE